MEGLYKSYLFAGVKYMVKSISLSKTQLGKLREYCQREGITHSDAIRRGLALLFEQRGKVKDEP